MLFNNSFAFNINKLFSDPNGRYIIICDIEIDQKCITLATLYAPNNDDPGFFEALLAHLLDFECDDIILGGDFNLVLDVDAVKKGGNPTTHRKCLDLVDAYRALNPDGHLYTWRRKKPEVSCRLDFFLASQSCV